jgi:predicted transcriptional regulator of viral defense system
MSKLLSIIKELPKEYFSIHDLHKISKLNRNSLRVSLSRAVKSGKITKLTNSLYTSDINLISWENLAINLYKPSYISFESALNYHNILSQQTSALTLATTKIRKEIEIDNKLLIYRHLKKDMFWGYHREDNYLLAEAEKAFLDLAYLSLNGYGHFDPEEMNLKLLNTNIIKQYLKKINHKRLSLKIKQVLINHNLS